MDDSEKVMLEPSARPASSVDVEAESSKETQPSAPPAFPEGGLAAWLTVIGG